MPSHVAELPHRRLPRSLRPGLLAACVCALIFLGSRSATAQRAGSGPREAPIINIRRQGAISGAEVTLNKIGYRTWTYLGIPFAQPPIGNLRFAPPNTDPPAWDGVRNGSTHMPACIQLLPAQPHPIHRLFTNVAIPSIGQIKTSEDCLYLNIYRPEGAAPDEKFPVMVWFHPGDFQWGAPMYWDASILAARHKVIVVTTAYRLNIFGFYTDNTADAAGNWGLLDQVAALNWVQRNIDSFGGSAQNVTVFGQGSGAVSVGLHVVSPASRNTFHRAISMSGNALLRTAVNIEGPDAESLDALTERFSCFRNSLTGCLRNAEVAALVAKGGSLIRWGPVVDGWALKIDGGGGASGGDHEPFLPDAPAALMDDGRFTMVPHLIGYNRMEDAFDIFGDDGGVVGGITRERFDALVRDAVLNDEEDRRRRIRVQQMAAAAAIAEAAAAAAAAAATTDESTGLSDGGGNVVAVSGGGGGDLDDDGNCTLNADFVVDTVGLRYADWTDDPETLRRNYVTMTANKIYGAPAYRTAVYVSRYNATYLYRYDYKLRAVRAISAATEWMDASHGSELPMVWGMPYWPTAVAIDWTTADRRMSDTMMAMWTNFAKQADPVVRPAGGQAQSYVKWDAFQPRNPRPMMVLDKVPNMSFTDQEPEFWNEYYPKVLAVSLLCCSNYTAESGAVPSAIQFRYIGPSSTIVLLPLALSFVRAISDA